MVFQRIVIKTLDLHCNTDNSNGKLQFVLCFAITYVVITVHYVYINITAVYCILLIAH